jgi:hypothetical protein
VLAEQYVHSSGSGSAGQIVGGSWEWRELGPAAPRYSVFVHPQRLQSRAVLEAGQLRRTGRAGVNFFILIFFN